MFRLFTVFSNLSNDCWFRIIAVSYSLTIGELICSSLKITVTLAVPPHFRSVRRHPSYLLVLHNSRVGKNFPNESTPCPPNPAIMISSFISFVFTVKLLFVFHCSKRIEREHILFHPFISLNWR